MLYCFVYRNDNGNQVDEIHGVMRFWANEFLDVDLLAIRLQLSVESSLQSFSHGVSTVEMSRRIRFHGRTDGFIQNQTTIATSF